MDGGRIANKAISKRVTGASQQIEIRKSFHLFEKAGEELQRSVTCLSISGKEFSLPLKREMQGDAPANLRD